MLTAIRPHGYARYKLDGCRCDVCKAARSAYARKVTMGTTAGTWQPWTAAAPARAHVLELGAAGIGYKRVAQLAHLPHSTVSKLLRGGPGDRPPTQKLRPATAAALLAVKADPSAIAPGTNIDATGTRRRIQALQCLGWTLTAQAEQIGWTTANFAALLNRHQISSSTATLVRDLYDRWSMATPPAGGARTRSVRHAHARGWFPPLAWDDDALDDPAATPVLLPPLPMSDPAADEWAVQHFAAGHALGELDAVTRDELVLRLREGGDDLTAIGKRLGLSAERVRQIHRRAVPAVA